MSMVIIEVSLLSLLMLKILLKPSDTELNLYKIIIPTPDNGHFAVCIIKYSIPRDDWFDFFWIGF